MGEKTSISPFIRAISSLSIYIPETHSIQVLATVLENKETQPFQSSICQNEAIQYSFDHDDLKTTINKITEFISTSQNINSGVETCINLLISFLIQRPNKRQLFLDLFSLLIIKYSQQTSDISFADQKDEAKTLLIHLQLLVNAIDDFTTTFPYFRKTVASNVLFPKTIDICADATWH